jgi:hypothetical protein
VTASMQEFCEREPVPQGLRYFRFRHVLPCSTRRPRRTGGCSSAPHPANAPARAIGPSVRACRRRGVSMSGRDRGELPFPQVTRRPRGIPRWAMTGNGGANHGETRSNRAARGRVHARAARIDVPRPGMGLLVWISPARAFGNGTIDRTTLLMLLLTVAPIFDGDPTSSKAAPTIEAGPHRQPARRPVEIGLQQLLAGGQRRRRAAGRGRQRRLEVERRGAGICEVVHHGCRKPCGSDGGRSGAAWGEAPDGCVKRRHYPRGPGEVAHDLSPGHPDRSVQADVDADRELAAIAVEARALAAAAVDGLPRRRYSAGEAGRGRGTQMVWLIASSWRSASCQPSRAWGERALRRVSQRGDLDVPERPVVRTASPTFCSRRSRWAAGLGC